MEHMGGCHCGNIKVRLRLSMPPQDAPLRACACAFCRAHGTRTVADTNGMFEITAVDWSLVELYRFGLRTADYFVCRRCGVYVGAVGDTPKGLRAVANVNCLADRAAFTRAPMEPDYDCETTEVRSERHAAKWMPAIVRR
jgi:hypothetical protein